MNTRLKITCCHECTERYPACHDSCPKYLEQKQQRMEEGSKIYNAKLVELRLDAVHNQSVARTKRRCHYK